jgi:hypothetical protein
VLEICRGTRGIRGVSRNERRNADRMGELLHKEITDQILGAFFQVHWELGPGYLESVYANGM